MLSLISPFFYFNFYYNLNVFSILYIGQKTSPLLLRLGLCQTWLSDWYNPNLYSQLLHHDLLTRNYLNITYSNYISSSVVSTTFKQNKRSTDIEALSCSSVSCFSPIHVVDFVCQGNRQSLRPFSTFQTISNLSHFTHISTLFTSSFHSLQPHFKKFLKLQPSFIVYRHLIFFYQLLKNRFNMKLVLFAMRRVYLIRTRLAFISFCFYGLQSFFFSKQPLLHSTSFLFSYLYEPLQNPLDHCLSLLRSIYWIKYKLDANFICYQKNLLYVKIKAFYCILQSDFATCSYSFSSFSSLSLTKSTNYMVSFSPLFLKLMTLNAWTCLLASVHLKRNKQYKHFIFNTIVKSISNPIYTAFDKHLLSYSLRHWLSALFFFNFFPTFFSTYKHPHFFYFSFTPSFCFNSSFFSSFTTPSFLSSVVSSNFINLVIDPSRLINFQPSCWFLDLFYLRPFFSFFDFSFQISNFYDKHVPFYYLNLLPHFFSSSLVSNFSYLLDHNIFCWLNTPFLFHSNSISSSLPSANSSLSCLFVQGFRPLHSSFFFFQLNLENIFLLNYISYDHSLFRSLPSNLVSFSSFNFYFFNSSLFPSSHLLHSLFTLNSSWFSFFNQSSLRSCFGRFFFLPQTFNSSLSENPVSNNLLNHRSTTFLQPKSSRCILKKSSHRLLIQLNLFMPTSNLSSYRDLLTFQRRIKHQHSLNFQSSSYFNSGLSIDFFSNRFSSLRSSSNFTWASGSIPPLSSLKRFPLIKSSSLFLLSFIHLNIIRHEFFSFYFTFFITNFEVPFCCFFLSSFPHRFIFSFDNFVLYPKPKHFWSFSSSSSSPFFLLSSTTSLTSQLTSQPFYFYHDHFIIKHLYSKSQNASLLAINISRSSIAYLKRNKGSKNKFQQLKNMSYKILLGLCSSRFGLDSRNLHSSVFNIQNHTSEINPALFFDLRLPRRRLGIGFSFSGRVYGATKATSFKMLFNSVPFNTLHANIDYSHLTQKTRNGTWGFQTWLHLSKKKTINVIAFVQSNPRP